jgi:hypothetical protein
MVYVDGCGGTLVSEMIVTGVVHGNGLDMDSHAMRCMR